MLVYVYSFCFLLLTLCSLCGVMHHLCICSLHICALPAVLPVAVLHKSFTDVLEQLHGSWTLQTQTSHWPSNSYNISTGVVESVSSGVNFFSAVIAPSYHALVWDSFHVWCVIAQLSCGV
ncbi:hypothetical protein COO60DRAFT_1570762 [Scenedesmus sp. NREL 46B-D3]|nr:hypothetical protein COO60DRAFT_1570762 [Scenedesmus sp. NREL 46B-D3]